MEKDILFVIAHILGTLMGDGFEFEQRIFMQEYLYKNEYEKLIKNPVYYNQLIQFLHEEYDNIYMCPICSTRTFIPEKKCLICLNSFHDKIAFRYAICGYCGQEMVIYDALNIKSNNNMLRGLCLNCENDTIVYQCPKCDSINNLEMFEECFCKPDYCKPDYCKYD